MMRMPESKGKELTGSWKNYAMTFKIWSLRVIKSRIGDGWGLRHTLQTTGIQTGRTDHLKELGVHGKIILKQILT